MTLGIGASMFSTPGAGYFTSQSFGEPKLSSTFPDKVRLLGFNIQQIYTFLLLNHK